MTDDVPALVVSVLETPTGPVVMLRGDVDMATADQIEQAAGDLIGSGHTTLTVDMSEVAFCDSAGLTTLVRIKKACNDSGGQFAVSSPQPHVLHVLALSGLTEYLGVTPATPAQ